MMTFISANELARRVRVAQATLAKRLKARGVMPDAIVVNGTKRPGYLFDTTRLPEIRRALCTTPEPIATT